MRVMRSIYITIKNIYLFLLSFISNRVDYFLLFFWFHSSPIRLADKRSRDMMKKYCAQRQTIPYYYYASFIFVLLVNEITRASRIYDFDMR